MKKAALKAFAIFTGNMCVRVLSTCVPATLLKRESKHVFSCQYCKIFKKTQFEEHLQTAASIIFSQDAFTLCQ